MTKAISLKEQKQLKSRPCLEDRIMYAIVNTLMVLLCIIVIFPLVYVVSCSFSDSAAIAAGRVVLLPINFSVDGYKMVFSYKEVWTGYANTIFYTVVGTAVNLLLTTIVAYPLSRRNFQWKKFYVAIFMFTMWFSGGLIPTYILMTKLHLTGTRWALIIGGGSMSVYNMIVMRTFFQNSIPYELLEASKVDGISDFRYLLDIVLPLSKAIFAVITLYYAVAHWNAYFGAMIYLRDSSMYPLQLILREILLLGNVDPSMIDDPDMVEQLTKIQISMNYALIVVSSAPLLVAYPYVQKFFEKGVMIGSVKG